MKQLGDNQTGLGSETRELADKELSSTPVFRKLVEKAANAMQEAGERFDELVMQKPDVKMLPDAEAGKSQANALRRLMQVMGAIKEEMNNLSAPEGGGGGGAGGGGDEPGGGEGGAAVRVPRTMGCRRRRRSSCCADLQAEVKQKTEEFRRDHPDLDNVDDKAKAQLDGLRRDQLDIIELFDEMRRLPNEMPDAGVDADKKPKADGDKKP